MELIIIFLLCLLASTKVFLQGLFSKNNVNSFADGLFFNGLIFLFSAIVFIKDTCTFNLDVLLFGIVFGTLTVLFQSCYIKAMSCGNFSLTVLIINLSMIIPMLFSAVVYNERISALRFIGILLSLAALAFNLNPKAQDSCSFKWLRLALLASLANGLLAVCQQLFGKTLWGNFTKEFVAYSYITAAVVSAIIYGILKSKGVGISFKLRPSVFLVALGIGVVLSVFQLVNTWAIANIESTLLFPTYNGGTLILSSVTGVLFLKDKLKFNQYISIAIGVIAIVIINV